MKRKILQKERKEERWKKKRRYDGKAGKKITKEGNRETRKGNIKWRKESNKEKPKEEKMNEKITDRWK